MFSYDEQIYRIKDKLFLAKHRDPDYQVFGSETHKYLINAPASANEIIAFETRYGVKLPDCYKSFIAQIGNGGEGYAGSAAGPFYGIYPLGEHLDDLLFEHAEDNLKNECVLKPGMTRTDWDTLTEELEKEDISDERYDQELIKLYGGVLPIGTQGCSYIHALVLTGEHKGRVVNMDISTEEPYFAPEKNFLDWYEAWLDGVIGKKETE